jgi:hypothetical protein
MKARAETRSRWWKAARGLALVLAIPFVVELGFRGVQAMRGQPCSSWAIRGELRQIARARIRVADAPRAEEGDRERFAHAFVGYEWIGGAHQLDQLLQTRSASPDARRFTVLVLGGTLASSFARDGRAQLEQRLRADPRFADREIEWLDFARESFKQPQQVLFLHYLLGLGIAPNAVLDIDGFDELACARSNVSIGTHPLFPSIALWGELAARGATDRLALDELVKARSKLRAAARCSSLALTCGLYQSAVLGELVLARAHSLREASERDVEAGMALISDASRNLVIRGPELPAGDAELLALCVGAWAEGSRMLQALCTARGIAFAHVLEPALPTAINASSNDVARFVAQGYPLLREEGAKLAAGGVAFQDASHLLDGDAGELAAAEALTSTGLERLADAAARALLESLRAADGSRR